MFKVTDTFSGWKSVGCVCTGRKKSAIVPSGVLACSSTQLLLPHDQ